MTPNKNTSPSGDDEPAEIHYVRRLSAEEFLIDFFGGLVPGILFLIAMSFALIPALHAVMSALIGSDDPNTLGAWMREMLAAMKETPSTLWIGAFIGALLFAYTIGHLFYRHDPKQADRQSFARLSANPDNDTDDNRRKNLGCASEAECEFPYPYYDKYLEQRGHQHLIPLVIWRDEPDKRSKTYINVLKTRLRFYHPDRCGILIRNEAHVRLAASTWYVSTLLKSGSLLCFLLAAVSALLSWGLNKEAAWAEFFPTIGWYLPSIAAPALVWITAGYAARGISGFLHYQRMREVFHVLETAFVAFRNTSEHLRPPYDDDFELPPTKRPA